MTAERPAAPTGPEPITSGERAPAGQPPPPAERGATVIRDRVVTKVAARAAQEALALQVGAPLTRLGLNAPKASATVRGDSARVALLLDLPYPVDIVHATRELQDRIGQRLADLTGLTISEVDLTIRRLVVAAGRGRVR